MCLLCQYKKVLKKEKVKEEMQEFHSSGHHCCLLDVKCTLHTHMVESLLSSWWWYWESFGTGGKQ